MCWESCLRSSRPCRITSIAGAPDVKDIIADNNDARTYYFADSIIMLGDKIIMLVTSKALVHNMTLALQVSFIIMSVTEKKNFH